MNGWNLRNSDIQEDAGTRSGGVIYSEPKILESSQNRIYFYSEIGRSEILRLNKNLIDMANTHIYEHQVKETDTPIPIKLHINSFGGGVFYGLAGMDEILKTSQKVEIHTIVDGCCASAATFLSVVGTKRFINKHAFMLIHQLSTIWWGTYEEMKDEMANLDKIMDIIKGIYIDKTKLPEEKIEEILKHDLWLSAEECVEYGLADEIL